MNTLYLKYHSYSEGGEPINPDDEWPDYEIVYKSFTPTSLHLSQQGWQENIETLVEPEIGKRVYVMVVRYGDGDTFGHSDGNWQVIGAFDNEKEVYAIKKAIERSGELDKEDSYDTAYDCVTAAFKPSGISVHPAWIGYFNSLESVEIHKMVIQQ